MRKKRTSPPKRERILQYWISDDAQTRTEKMSEVFDNYRAEFQYYLLCNTVTHKDSTRIFCFACLQEYRQWDELQRCHIVPHGLKGSNDPSNFVLLCPLCHKKNPHSIYDDVFLMWMALMNLHKKSISIDLTDALFWFNIDPKKYDQLYDQDFEKWEKVLRDACHGLAHWDFHNKVAIAGAYYKQSINHEVFESIKHKRFKGCKSWSMKY